MTDLLAAVSSVPSVVILQIFLFIYTLFPG